MTRNTSASVRWTVLVPAAAALLATGAGAMYFVLRSSDPPGSRAGLSTTTVSAPAAGTPASSAPASSAPAPDSRVPEAAGLPDVTVTLTEDAVKRAGITVAPVGAGSATATLRLPGLVQPNAYRQVSVTPLVAGRITRVLVELGEQVRSGQTMAHIFSPELTDAHTRYQTTRAELEAHERELRRTEKLVDIGAASRQELERLHAEHTAQTADVQSARSRLELLGVPPAALDAATPGEPGASINVPAPIAGVVTERMANVGLNVDLATRLFTVVDLATVWVVADLYEKDFSRVRVGSAATVTTTAYPDRVLQGRVSYIDPQVSAETRTARVRVEVPNDRNQLRLGMYADVAVADPGTATIVISRRAVQSVGDRQVVYLVNPKESGTFTEREVRLGTASGDQVEVLSGVQAGDVVVSEGSFFVRAERERLGPRTLHTHKNQ